MNVDNDKVLFIRRRIVIHQCSANDLLLTHPKMVELSAIKHLTKNLPIQIKCAAFKDKLRELAVMDDGSLLRLTIEAIESKMVPFRNSHYLVSDLKECKELLGPTGELIGEALANAKLRAANLEIEQLKEALQLKEQSKEERDRLIDSVPDQIKLTYKLLGTDNAYFMDRCYVYYILFGKQRPLSRNDIESVVRMRTGLGVFKGDVIMSSSTKQELEDLFERLFEYKSLEYSNPAVEFGTCLEYVKTVV